MNADTDSEMLGPKEIVASKEEMLAEIETLLSRLKESAKQADEYAAAALKSSQEATASQTAASEIDKAIGLIKVDLEAQKVAVTESTAVLDKIEDDADVKLSNVISLLQKVEQNKKSVEETTAEIALKKTAADQMIAEATATAGQIQAVLNSVQPSKLAIIEHQTALTEVLEESNNSKNQLKNLADMAQTTEEKIAAYEGRLADLDSQCATQLKTIIELLPGAGSAGLAAAFESRQDAFRKPAKWWHWLFIGTVLLLIGIAASGPVQAVLTGHTLSNEELLRGWIIRLPIAGGLIWLALHASHEAALAKRLEEDYGYKATIAASFLAFHNHLMKITAEFKDTPLEKLSSDTLGIIATPPGRIYEKHELTTSLTTKIGEAVASALKSHLPKTPPAS